MPATDPLITDLRTLRRMLRIPATQVAPAAGVTTAAISRLEQGHTDPRLSTLRGYAKAIGYDLHLVSAATGDAHLTPLLDLTAGEAQALRDLADRLLTDAGWITPDLRTALDKLRTSKESTDAH